LSVLLAALQFWTHNPTNLANQNEWGAGLDRLYFTENPGYFVDYTRNTGRATFNGCLGTAPCSCSPSL
jgi:hypothetical protein